MLTLREFLKKSQGYHYRIYQPNRDCLIFESYFTVHSPYYFGDAHKDNFEINESYFEDNKYNKDFLTKYRNIYVDEETTNFLKEFGDYEVNYIECCNFKPHDVIKKDGNIEIIPSEEPRMPDRDYIPCFNIFISPPGVYYLGCENCMHSLLDKDKGIFYNDIEDKECLSCPNFKKEV